MEYFNFTDIEMRPYQAIAWANAFKFGYNLIEEDPTQDRQTAPWLRMTPSTLKAVTKYLSVHHLEGTFEVAQIAYDPDLAKDIVQYLYTCPSHHFIIIQSVKRCGKNKTEFWSHTTKLEKLPGGGLFYDKSSDNAYLTRQIVSDDGPELQEDVSEVHKDQSLWSLHHLRCMERVNLYNEKLPPSQHFYFKGTTAFFIKCENGKQPALHTRYVPAMDAFIIAGYILYKDGKIAFAHNENLKTKLDVDYLQYLSKETHNSFLKHVQGSKVWQNTIAGIEKVVELRHAVPDHATKAMLHPVMIEYNSFTEKNDAQLTLGNTLDYSKPFVLVVDNGPATYGVLEPSFFIWYLHPKSDLAMFQKMVSRVQTIGSKGVEKVEYTFTKPEYVKNGIHQAIFYSAQYQKIAEGFKNKRNFYSVQVAASDTKEISKHSSLPSIKILKDHSAFMLSFKAKTNGMVFTAACRLDKGQVFIEAKNKLTGECLYITQDIDGSFRSEVVGQLCPLYTDIAAAINTLITLVRSYCGHTSVSHGYRRMNILFIDDSGIQVCHEVTDPGNTVLEGEYIFVGYTSNRTNLWSTRFHESNIGAWFPFSKNVWDTPILFKDPDAIPFKGLAQVLVVRLQNDTDKAKVVKALNGKKKAEMEYEDSILEFKTEVHDKTSSDTFDAAKELEKHLEGYAKVMQNVEKGTVPAGPVPTPQNEPTDPGEGQMLFDEPFHLNDFVAEKMSDGSIKLTPKAKKGDAVRGSSLQNPYYEFKQVWVKGSIVEHKGKMAFQPDGTSDNITLNLLYSVKLAD